jgi:hypothetical protein
MKNSLNFVKGIKDAPMSGSQRFSQVEQFAGSVYVSDYKDGRVKSVSDSKISIPYTEDGINYEFRATKKLKGGYSFVYKGK